MRRNWLYNLRHDKSSAQRMTNENWHVLVLPVVSTSFSGEQAGVTPRSPRGSGVWPPSPVRQGSETSRVDVMLEHRCISCASAPPSGCCRCGNQKRRSRPLVPEVVELGSGPAPFVCRLPNRCCNQNGTDKSYRLARWHPVICTEDMLLGSETRLGACDPPPTFGVHHWIPLVSYNKPTVIPLDL